MSQMDWVGASHVPEREFRDIRNQRPSIAERKAQLVLELHHILSRPPACVVNASVQRVRGWLTARKTSAKVTASTRSSVQELQSAIANMRRLES